jgi:hypothetical protein
VAAHYAGARAAELAAEAAATPETDGNGGPAPSTTVTVTDVTVDEVTVDLDATESEV